MIKSTRFGQINQQSNQPRNRVDAQPYAVRLFCSSTRRSYFLPLRNVIMQEEPYPTNMCAIRAVPSRQIDPRQT